MRTFYKLRIGVHKNVVLQLILGNFGNDVFLSDGNKSEQDWLEKCSVLFSSKHEC